MPVEWIGLLFALAAEPRPAPPPDTEVSLELLEYLGGIDTAPTWVRDDPIAPPATDATTTSPRRPPEPPR